MSLGTEYIIRYLSDISGVVKGAKDVENINMQMAASLKGSYSDAVRVVGTNFNKLSQTSIKLPDGTKVAAQLKTLGTTIVDTNGKYQLFTRTLIDGKLDETSGKLSDVTNKFRVGTVETEKAAKSLLSLTGQTSKLATDFTKVSDVNAKFSNELKKFGSATGVIESGLVKVSGNTQKLEAVVQTTDGKFLKLNETITNTPDGMQKISRSALDVSDKYIKLTKVQDNLVTTSSQLGTNFKNLTDINNKFAKQLTGVGSISRVVGQNINEISGNTASVGIIAQTATGQFVQLKESLTKSADGAQTVNRSMKDVTGQFVKGNIEVEKGAKFFSNLTDNVKQLAARALLTIPIWIALRASIMGVFSGIQGGIQNLIAFDLALQKIRNNLQGTPEAVDAAFKKIRSSITEASKATGISTEELAGAVKQFATLGFSANESLQGALGTSKLSIALFGNASDTAEAFAKALNILIDRSLGAKSAADQMNEAFALTSQLEETNNFEIKNVTEALNKFAGTAAGVGLTMNQTLQILAALGTAGRTGSEGATLLSTSFNQLLKNLPNLSQKLGLVTATGETTFSIFTRILNKITELNQTPGGRNAAIEAISDIFGGARGIKIVQSLVAVKSILDANIAILPKFDALNAKVKRTLESESGQAKILGNNLKETAKSFVTALIGSEDFTNSLIKLNQVVTKIGGGLKPLGTTINAIFSNLGFIAGAAFLLRFGSVVTVGALFARIIAAQAAFEIMGVKLAFLFSRGFLVGLKALGKLAIGSLALGFTGASAGAVVAGLAKFLLSPVTLIATVIGKIAADALTNNFIKGIEEKNTKAQAAFNKLIDGLRGNLAISDLIIEIEKLTLKQKFGDQAMQQQISALRKRLKEQIETGKIEANVQAEVTPLMSFKDQQDIAKLLVANSVDRLKQEGALNSEILIATQLRNQQLNIQEDTITKLGRQLDIEKAINEEKRLQSKLSSDTVKLYDIAITEGIDIASQIGDVLANNTDFDMFVRRGGKALEIFKTQFEDIFKQQQALQFFRGDVVAGKPGLQGGSRIAIQEEALRRPISSYDTDLEISRMRAEEQFTRIATVAAQVPVTINNTIDISNLNEVKDKVVKEISKQLPTVGSDVNNALIQALVGKQGNNL